MAQNEMKAKPALPERVRSMEGLGVWLEVLTARMAGSLTVAIWCEVNSKNTASLRGPLGVRVSKAYAKEDAKDRFVVPSQPERQIDVEVVVPRFGEPAGQ